MDKELKEKWLAALRGGEYRQGKFTLHSDSGNTYCCLGVLACVATGKKGFHACYGSAFDPYSADPDKVLQDMNDKTGKSFSEIADWIEANL